MSDSQIPSNPDMLNYYYFKDAFTSEEISKIINMCDKLELSEVTTGDTISNDTLRRSKVGYLSPHDESLWIYEKLFLLCEQANEEMGWDFHIDGIYDDIEYSIYEENSGKYEWYSNINDSINNKLCVTLNLSLPEEYKGGNLDFNLGIEIDSIPNEVASLIIVPSYVLSRTTPIISGVKRTLKLSISGNKFK